MPILGSRCPLGGTTESSLLASGLELPISFGVDGGRSSVEGVQRSNVAESAVEANAVVVLYESADNDAGLLG